MQQHCNKIQYSNTTIIFYLHPIILLNFSRVLLTTSFIVSTSVIKTQKKYVRSFCLTTDNKVLSARRQTDELSCRETGKLTEARTLTARFPYTGQLGLILILMIIIIQ